jgi:hypothetical protein
VLEVLEVLVFLLGRPPDEMRRAGDGFFHLLVVHFGVFAVLFKQFAMGAPVFFEVVTLFLFKKTENNIYYL